MKKSIAITALILLTAGAGVITEVGIKKFLHNINYYAPAATSTGIPSGYVKFNGRLDGDIESRIKELEEGQSNIFFDVLKLKNSDSLLIDAKNGDSGFQKVDTPTGPVLLSLRRVEPYLDGFHLFFDVGNIGSGDLIGISGNIFWTEKDGGAKSKKYALSDRFPSGSWRSIKIATGPMDNESLSNIYMSVNFPVIELRRNKQ